MFFVLVSLLLVLKDSHFLKRNISRNTFLMELEPPERHAKLKYILNILFR